jgi:hypothetical protein
MKNTVSPGVAIGIIVVVVLVLGFVAYRTLFPNTNASPDSAEAKKQYEEIHARSAIHQQMGGGGGGASPSEIQGARGAYGHAGGANQAAPSGSH